MSRISLVMLAALLCLGLLSACGKDARPEYEYADNKDVRIEKIEKREIDGGFMEISITFRNKNKKDLNHPKYRVHWFDSGGIMLEQTSWRPLRIKGGAAMYARERSTRPGAKEFTVVISNEE